MSMPGLGLEAMGAERPLLITASPRGHIRNTVIQWTIALGAAGIVYNWTIPRGELNRVRLAADWPLLPYPVVDAGKLATDWAGSFDNSAGLLVLNPDEELIAGMNAEDDWIKVAHYLGTEPDRAMQRALGMKLPVALSDGYPTGHPSPLMQPEALQAQGVHALDPNLSIRDRVAQLPELIGGLLIEPPRGEGQAQ